MSRPAPGQPCPVSTYRLQMGPQLTFDEAAAVAPRLAALGVSHVYLSPILASAPGSTHGYDVVDPTRIDEEMGGREGFERFVAACRGAGLGIVLDIVPNHVATPVPAHLNPSWWGLLSDGEESEYASWFDVDHDAHDGRVLVPILGGTPQEAIDNGELVIDREGGPGGTPVLRYHEHVLPVRPETLDLPLPELVEAQPYRLAFWRTGDADLNVRRFFNVTDLVGVRVEDPEVFDATHALVVELVRSGAVDGLRIDHPDGLADPQAYLDRLAEATGGVWVVVEKILEGEEELPQAWACEGTTGYDTMTRLGQLFCDPAAEPDLSDLWRAIAGDVRPIDAWVDEAKREVVDGVLLAERRRLSRRLAEVLPEHDRDALERVVVELLVNVHRYRAYVTADGSMSADARGELEAAAQRAIDRLQRSDHPADADLVAAVVEVLSGSAPGADADAAADCVIRFQQTCGPVMAKGVEDTTFYRYLRATGLNEVGGDPGTIGMAPPRFAAYLDRIAARWPRTMTALTTHDTKRSEDVRARLVSMTEDPAGWAEWVARARDLGAAYRGERLDAPTEYLVWQTLVGAWPIDAPRMHDYLRKAVRESGRHSTWIDVDEEYESQVAAFVDGLLDDDAVRDHVRSWVDAHAEGTRAVILGQKLLQLIGPGVPDVYQGTEIVSLTLVDPDNRRDVDHDAIGARLERLDRGAGPADLDDEKLRLAAAALRLRRAHPDWFVGPDAITVHPTCDGGHAVALARGAHDRVEVVALVRRLTTALAADGGSADAAVELPEGGWTDVLRPGVTHAGGRVPLARVLADGPVALLVREAAP